MAHREMSDVTRIQYLRSEIVVSTIIYEAATRIFSTFISSRQTVEKNESEMLEKSVRLALELALMTDRLITQSGDTKAPI